MEKEQIINEMRRTIKTEAEALQSLLENTDMEKMARVVELIGKKQGKSVIAGCGTSAMAAKKVAHSLNCIECPAVFLNPSDAVHGGLGLLGKDDVLFLFSKGGNTKELLRLIPACRKKGAVLVGITENEKSVIAQEADIFLKVKVEKEPCRFNMLATASTMAVISVFDAICIALMEYTKYTKEQFAVIHPGGAVGERLLGKRG